MPYVITTAGRLADGRLHQWSDPTAVATLDKARLAAHRAGASLHNANRAIQTDGGTIGPLPDGTVIEVRRVS